MTRWIAAAAVLWAPLAAAQDWMTFHGGGSLEGRAATAPPDRPAFLWRHRAGGRVETTPVTAGGRIFFATHKGDLAALDASGAELWKVSLGKDVTVSPLLATDGLVVLGTQAGKLRAFSAEDGAERWSHDVEDVIQGSPNRVALPGGRAGVVAISNADGVVHCVDLETGKPVWKSPPVDRCDGSPSVGGGRVILGSCASALHLVSEADGTKTADVDLGGDNQVAAGVALSGDLAFAGTRSGKVVAVDLKARKVLWVNADTRREAFTTPAVDGDAVVFGSDDGRIYRLDRRTGAKVWAFDTGGSPKSPVIAGNRVVASSGGRLFLLDLETGGKVWSVQVGDDATSPAVVGGRILVGADDGTVSAYGAK